MTIPEQRRKDLEEALKVYHEVLYGKPFLHSFKEYNIVYQMCNESIKALSKTMRYKFNKKILSVLASGDQVFSMINWSTKQIDTFDINRLTEYYTLGFKKTAIENLNYQQFVELFDSRHNGYKYDLEQSVISCAPGEYKWFWEEFLRLAKQECPFHKPSVFDLVKGSEASDLIRGKQCAYLESQKNYIQLQKRLRNTKITFTQCDIRDLPSYFGNYDFLFLSNILDYFEQMYSQMNYSEAKETALNLFRSICNNNLNDSGEIILTDFDFGFAYELRKRTEFKKSLINYYDKGDSNPTMYGWRKGEHVRKLTERK